METKAKMYYEYPQHDLAAVHLTEHIIDDVQS